MPPFNKKIKMEIKNVFCFLSLNIFFLKPAADRLIMTSKTEIFKMRRVINLIRNAKNY
jgi:hypothetical protein